MPISSDLFPAIEDTFNRLAAESVLAQPGRDDGLIPTYSLLGELRELCTLETAVRRAIDGLLADLERRLDDALPFDEAVLVRLRSFVAWMPGALAELRQGRPAPPMAEAAPAAEAAADTPDVVMKLDLAENHDLLVEFHAESADHLQQVEAALLVLDQRPDDPEAVNAIFRSFHTIKGNAGFLGLTPMHSLAHEVESLLDLARNHRLRLNSAIVTEILRSRDALQALTQQIGVALERGTLPDRVVPVHHLICAVRALSQLTGAPAVAQPNAPAELPAIGFDSAPEAGPARAPAEAAAPADGPKPKAGASQTVRVNTEKLDLLMDMVGELVIVQRQLIETGGATDDASPLHRNLVQLNRITKELQHTAMSLRMIPIKPTFQKMERLARDVARECGKKVNFVTNGEDTELDRTVVEEIADPLVHMVRNAIDHGVETPAERKSGGKTEAGTVLLKAYHQGSSVVIELQDDGRGIDPVRVLAKARERGLVAADAELTKEEILNLVFLPGFSTAERVTSLSGRGVGMDVVKRNIERLRGKVEITSEVGRGSDLKIKLPLTMAIIDGLVVRVGEDRFILPSTSVQRALRPLKENIVRVQGKGEVLDLRGRLLPLYRLHRRFGIPTSIENPWDGIVVIVESSDRVCALLVDELMSKQEVVIKNLGGFMASLPGVAGGAILGDGNIALILDPAALLQAA